MASTSHAAALQKRHISMDSDDSALEFFDDGSSTDLEDDSSAWTAKAQNINRYPPASFAVYSKPFCCCRAQMRSKGSYLQSINVVWAVPLAGGAKSSAALRKSRRVAFVLAR